MSHTPSATVIIPTRNRVGLLREAVASVARQTLGDWELLVVDDASADETPQWLATLRDTRVRPLRLEEHSERSAARNHGLSAARAPFVLFLDDDDELLPCALADLSALLRRHPAAAAAVGHIEVAHSGGLYRPPRAPCVSECVPWREVIAGWLPLQGQALFRRSVLAAVGGYASVKSRGEDQDLWLRLSPHAVVLGPSRVVRVRIHETQSTRGDPDFFDDDLGLRLRFLQRLPPSRRAAARIAVEFWKDERRARQCERRGDESGARRHLWAAFRRSPSLALSPLLRTPFLYALAKSCVPRALRDAARRLLGRSPAPRRVE